MVKLVVPFKGILLAPKAFALVGGLMTLSVSLAVLPLPAIVELMVTLLLYKSSTVLDTFTVMLQVPTANAALVKLIVPDPAAAVTVPPQVLVTAGVAATTRLPGCGPPTDGRVSVKLASIGTTLPLVIANVIVLTLGPVPVPPVVWIVF